MFPEVEQKRSTPTFIDRFEQYPNEHKMAENTYNIYKPTLKKLKRYEAYKREIDGIKDFHLYVETITSDDYHDFEEYIQSEHELFKEYGDFYSQFGLKGASVPKPMAIVSIYDTPSTNHSPLVHKARLYHEQILRPGFQSRPNARHTYIYHVGRTRQDLQC